MKTILITGATGGIGKELAIEFAKKNNNLFLVARNEEKLIEVKKEITEKYAVNVEYLALDLSDNPKYLYDYCHLHDIKVDVLVNNAGFGDYGRFIDADIDKLLAMIDLNNKALVSLTYYFISDMRSNGGGHVVNVGSVASFIPGPYMAVYYATKAFVLSFSMALREELRNDNIKVSTLCPSPTKSDFWKVANGETTAVYNNVFARNPSSAAKTGIKMYEKNKAYAIDGLFYSALIGVAKVMPIELCARVVAFVQSKTKSKG